MPDSNLQRVDISEVEVDGSGWLIEVYNDGVLLHEKVKLCDPFSPSQNADLQWYLEEYATKSPFEFQRASTVAAALNDYAKQLQSELCLDTLWESADQSGSSNLINLQICIRSASNNAQCANDELGLPRRSIQELKWELLETPSIWPPFVGSVMVIRRSDITTKEIEDDKHPIAVSKGKEAYARGTAIINVLLVIARNTKADPTAYEDVDPFVVLKCMLSIQRQLESQRGLTGLNVEVVRPGTFEALRAHLTTATEKHGPGFYHLVHFDAHGRVAYLKDSSNPGRRIRSAFLRFASSNTWRDVNDVPAPVIGTLLGSHGIKSVVLNACQSARANEGVNANLSATFAEHGVSNILALSSKMLSNAVSSLILKFYEELFLRRQTFSEAASAARKTLRTDTARMARFGLEVSLLDWAVPVIYSSGRDIETTKPNMKASESPCCEGSTRELRAQNQDGSQQVPRTQTMGQHSRKVTSTLYRGFVDFVASVSQRLQTIYIQPLKHFAAADTWPIGRNFDILRLEQRLLESGTLFLHGPAGSGKTTLVSHLWHMWHKTNFFERTLYLDLSDDSLSNWQSWEELTSKNLKGYSANDTAKLKGVISDIRSHKSCVILDSTSWPYVSHATASQLAVQVNVFFFIERLLQEQCENCGDRNPFLILVGRDASEKWWQSHFKQLQGSLFPLGGLDLSGAILMCEEIMREGGVNVPKSDQNDLNFLIHIINLLQRNPLALKTIVPAAVNEKVRLASLFELLLIGEYNFPEGFADKLTVSFQKTFWNPIQTLLKETDQLDLIGNFMLFLAPFWTKGPSDIYKYLKTINIPLRTKIDPEEFVSFIRRFHDLGAISCEGAAISWMHPVFNLMLSNEIRLLNETSPKLSKMVECVFLVIAGDDLPISLDNLCQPVAPDIDVEFARFYFIALRIFHILGRKYPPTPTELWFCELVTIFPHKAGVILSMPEQELLLSFIKRAILTSIEHNPDYSFESDLLPVVWNLINFVATFYARTAGFGDPAFRQFTMIGIELLDSFESRNGTVPGFLKIFKNWVYRHKAFMLLHDGDEAAADRAWEAGKDYNILPRQSWTGVSNESVFSLQTASPQDQLALLASIPKQSGDVLGKVWEDIKKNYQAYREGRINSLYDNVLRKDPKPFWMKDGSFDHMTQLIDELGLGDLGVSKQAVNDAGRSLDTPEALMSALESARDVGDDQNQRAFATYLGYTAMRNGKFPQQTPRFDLITSFMQGSSTTDSQQAVISLIMRLADFMTKQSSLDMNARVTTEEKEKYLAAYNEAVDMVRQISGDLYADRLKSVLNVCVNGSKLPPDKIQEGIENCQKIFGEGSEITEAIRGFCASSSQNT